MVIEINNYPVFLKLGHFDHERVLGQEVWVSLELELLDSSLLGLSDDLDKTVNYGDVVQVIDQQIRGREVKLIETVVETIGQTILERFAFVKRTKVRVEKRVIPHELVKGARVSVVKDFER